MLMKRTLMKRRDARSISLLEVINRMKLRKNRMIMSDPCHPMLFHSIPLCFINEHGNHH
ncbi:unnamed protein product [Onchocerca flexuosa]|uniref:Ovule protein n=1 Tax=Onchocerca flexuosa TaxID=387005 RepID=A0A183HTI9_9BILA|nr:unnamed protein product [Onchocerca flexuosa]